MAGAGPAPRDGPVGAQFTNLEDLKGKLCDALRIISRQEDAIADLKLQMDELREELSDRLDRVAERERKRDITLQKMAERGERFAQALSTVQSFCAGVHARLPAEAVPALDGAARASCQEEVG